MAQIKNPLAGGGGAGGGAEVVNGIIEQYKAYDGEISPNIFVEAVSTPSEVKELDSQVIGTSYPGQSLSSDYATMCTLSDGCFLVAPSKNAVVITVQDGSISTGTTLSQQLGGTPSVVAIDRNTAVVVYQDGSNNRYLYAKVLTISDEGVITAGTSTQLSTTAYSGYSSNHSVQYIGDGKIYIAYGIGESYQTLWHMLCNVDGKTITIDQNSSIATGGGTALELVTIKLDPTHIGVFHYGSSTARVRLHITTVTGSTISTTQSIATVATSSLSNYSRWAVMLPDNNVLLGAWGSEDAILVKYNGGTSASLVGTISIKTGYAAQAIAFEDGELLFTGDRLQWAKYENGAVTTNSSYLNTGFYTYNWDTTASSRFCILAYGRNESDTTTIAKAFSYVNPTTIKNAASRVALFGLTKTACTADTPGDVWVLNASSTTTN